MVAKIKSGKSLIGALHYNENKVKAGKAKLIATNGYVKSHEKLSFYDKLFRLKDLAGRNFRTKTNTVHLSLNFDVSEQIDDDKLTAIADVYMKKIGFEWQPYLIYKHFDAGHPHIHIITTNIEADGSRISLHNIGRLVSEPARKEIELEFGLIQADSKKDLNKQIERALVKPLVYGSTDTKRAMTNIVNEVIQQYKFTSLPEFNAILKLYNIEADRGTKESVMFDKAGLRYWALDNHGIRVGVPIKASAIYRKPTLKLLEDQFRLGEYLRKPFKDKVKSRIDSAISKASTKDKFIDELKRRGIKGMFRENAEGRIYGVTYVDLENKVVFNGSDLGKNYSAGSTINMIQNNDEATSQYYGSIGDQEKDLQIENSLDSNSKFSRSILDELLSPTDLSGSENLFERRKKKKRRKLNL
ncbi:relaxase/mobilization nuclease domain-containing protein [Mucilaginibacter sp. KACC 22773]|uniref:relaxase/mobilization nuclease domain-containing protein n=1 Tax=Mucilaginibacter sp. KACC 22773 TaxID=3025671 RepID=UPI0023658F38|nr:relaxase/mobilization nuclease domain-containing protein [Mucilaginibacter sp. KACC 22773]WDF78951.1 relaxase/mobilization nuclease domain-containing protein [Mucilaginibacter sp. KACC 22773]